MNWLDLTTATRVYEALGPWLERFLGLEALLGAGILLALFWSSKPLERWGEKLFYLTLATLFFGFLLVCYLHGAIYTSVALKLPEPVVQMVNRLLEMMGERAPVSFAPYKPGAPPRYLIPPWIEEEKYLFWFLCYAILASRAYRRASWRLTKALLLGLLVLQVGLLAGVIGPLKRPLPNFFQEIGPWLAPLSTRERVGLFLQLYPRLLFYYNAPYMWVHPPLLLFSYAALSVFFVACLSMLCIKDPAVEKMAYTFARPGYLSLTVGMLLGFPWALEAWGPNWWWDPKIASSLMMWVVFSTYLHARLYLSRRGMWTFVGLLGILSFGAMVFTVVASYLFSGQHTVH